MKTDCFCGLSKKNTGTGVKSPEAKVPDWQSFHCRQLGKLRKAKLRAMGFLSEPQEAEM